ncbi:MAG: hypothetical protein A2175_01160 [Candidatus Nealsonbacteria bacterium RBG_13_42_11]|uniref:Uncharacterized protein n=1 Tax=Candidatus Nealsonbacteria bacterium RBG_13_42_11 TaxID=1801663 RepID=A0A1G2DYC8_9BACT|nr:MAG: hypothetical protein A2175_01160 [Candidatus Nealsonbacteria bacterium RBG_13_42_11]
MIKQLIANSKMTKWLIKKSATIISCVLIASFGTIVLVFSATTIYDNVNTTGNITASSTITAGESLIVASTGNADFPTANIGDISASSIDVSENMIVGNNLYVQSGLSVASGGMQIGGDTGIFASSSQPVLSVDQNGSGNIVEFKDAGTTIFYIADGGNATTTGNFNISGTLNIGEGTSILKHLSTTAAVDFDAIAANSCSIKTVSFSGVAVGDSIALGLPDELGDLDISWDAWVSAADIISIKACNASTSASDNPDSETVRISAWKY